MRAKLTSILILINLNHCCAQLVDGYTDKLSYSAGETVTFYTKSSGNSFSCWLYDLAGNPIVGIPSVTIINGFAPDIQLNKPDCGNAPWKNGYNYAPTNTWTVPALGALPNSLPSGYYLIDNPPVPTIHAIPIIIKGDNTTADIVIVCPTNTINAYTNNPASCPHSLYDPTIPTTTVSFHRPQLRIQYGNCDDGFLDWIKDWAASPVTNPNNYNLNFISDADMDDYNEIANAKLLVVPGHSEYWTRQARLNFDLFVDGDVQNNIPGKNALILSGNSMWMQVRYEHQNGNPDNTKLSCYRGANWCDQFSNCYSEDSKALPSDPNYDPLLATYHWSEPDLKYSIIGSIGSDSWRGGYGILGFANGGHKILLQQSPLLAGTGLQNGNSIPITTIGNEEFDGTFVIGDANGNAVLDVNGDPELDIPALGFYRAEMIGYHSTTTNGYVPNDPNANNNHNSFCPFMVFKKTCNSGTVINVNSNRWCTNNNNDWTVNPNTHLRPLITATMINLMIDDQINNYQGANLFSSANPAPNSITLKPSYSNVTYSACQDGEINFTPCGIYLNNAYKIDNGYLRNPEHIIQSVLQPVMINEVNNRNMNVAYIDNFCTTYQALRLMATLDESETENEQTDELIFSLFPNPTNSCFTLQMKSADAGVKDISIYTSIGKEIYQLEKSTAEKFVIDLSSQPKGIYFAKVTENGKQSVKKIIYM